LFAILQLNPYACTCETFLQKKQSSCHCRVPAPVCGSRRGLCIRALWEQGLHFMGFEGCFLGPRSSHSCCRALCILPIPPAHCRKRGQGLRLFRLGAQCLFHSPVSLFFDLCPASRFFLNSSFTELEIKVTFFKPRGQNRACEPYFPLTSWLWGK
jgi:hypothetical protein